MEQIVEKEWEGLSLKQVLQREMGLSTKLIKHLKFSEGGILVNGAHVTVRHILTAGERLTLSLEDREAAPIEPVDLPITVLYEDDDLVVPAKPAEMPTHPSHGHWNDTVANALVYRYESRGVPFVFRPINRLDRNTSGLLLVARNRHAAGVLSGAMCRGEIQKTYLAVLDGVLDTESGRIDAPLHRTKASIIVREVCSPDAPDADAALTEYRVLARSGHHTLVEARPITGRTHQLRVHFAHLGHPITGDDLYGVASDEIARHALHARTLTFPHPTTGEQMTLKAPLPADLAALLRLHFPSLAPDTL